MKKAPRIILFLTVFLALASFAAAARPEGTMAFAVSMEQPTTHYYHVVFRCEGLKGETQDFKMPSWTPGYYWILNSARNVLNFRAEDGAGSALAWEKTAKNTWRVKSGKAAAITVSYDVYAFERSFAESFLDDGRGFISPTGIFMHVAGRLGHPVTVSFEPYKEWSRISTGLDPVEGRPNTFFAPDFDVLYDCPVLMGNQEILTFEIKGIPHVIAVENLGTVDRAKFKSDLTKIVEGAARLIGEIPYKHYTFIFMDGGGRGHRAPEFRIGLLQRLRPELAFRLLGRTELHRPRVLPPLQRQADPAGRAGPVRLRQGKLHEHALGVGGDKRVLRGHDPQAGRAHDPGRVP
jgi:hypothetical protein